MRRISSFAVVGVLVTTASTPHASYAAGENPGLVTLVSARVSLEGTSNIHPYTASSRVVRVSNMQVTGTPPGDPLDYVLQPGALKQFDVAIAAASLSSPREGVDKNMHKALKVDQHPDITFSLRSVESHAGAYRAVGALTVAGVEKEVTLTLDVQPTNGRLAVTGTTDLLMTDFGIQPPKAMLGLLKTDPKVTIRIELELGSSAK